MQIPPFAYADINSVSFACIASTPEAVAGLQGHVCTYWDVIVNSTFKFSRLSKLLPQPLWLPES